MEPPSECPANRNVPVNVSSVNHGEASPQNSSTISKTPWCPTTGVDRHTFCGHALAICQLSLFLSVSG